MPSSLWERNDDEDALLLMLSLLLLMSSIGARPISWIMRRVFALIQSGEVWERRAVHNAEEQMYTQKRFPKKKAMQPAVFHLVVYGVEKCALIRRHNKLGILLAVKQSPGVFNVAAAAAAAASAFFIAVTDHKVLQPFTFAIRFASCGVLPQACAGSERQTPVSVA